MPLHEDKTVASSESPELKKFQGENLFSGTTLGENKILHVIGQGGMGVVYKAYQKSLRREVALKVLKKSLSFSSDYAARFQEEARSSAGLRHPNIVQIYGIGEDSDIHYFIMELVTGKTLKDLIGEKKKGLLRSRRFLTVHETLQIIRQVAAGLYYAHEKGIIHSDIKPSNVIIDDETGRPMIADFGLARPRWEKGKTVSSGFSGTPLYMAPELFSGGKATVQIDIYSLGATLFELLTFEPVFQLSKLSNFISQVQREAPRPVHQFNQAVPDEISAVIEKCLAKSPDDRYRSAEDFIRDIDLFLDHGRTTASEGHGCRRPVQEKPEKPQRNWKRKALLILSTCVLMTFLYYGSNVYFEQRRQRLFEAHCKSQLEIAHNYFQLKRRDLALPLLQKLCETYPDSEYAWSAERMIKENYLQNE